VIGFLFLEETHAEKKYRRDPGLEFGRWLVTKFSAREGPSGEEKFEGNRKGDFRLFEEDLPPVYSSREGSPRPSSVDGPRTETPDEDIEQQYSSKGLGIGKAFTKQVIFNIVGYGILA
jgi:hypothetical protein